MVTACRSQAPTLLSISDDFTGAVACASELLAAGCQVAVRNPTSHAWPGGYDAVVLDTSSRRLGSREAAERTKKALRTWCRQSRSPVDQVYKRVDSGLRGNVAAELSAISDELRLPLLIAVAAPALGMTTSNGVQYFDDHEITRSRYGGVESPATPRIAQILDERAIELGLSSIRGADLEQVLSEAFKAATYVICDAETPGDLLSIGAAAIRLLDRDIRCVLVGSYGLAGAWARAVGLSRAGEAPGALVVCGSRMTASAQQLNAFRQMGAADHVSDVLESVSRLRDGQDVIVSASASHQASTDEAVGSLLAREVKLLLEKARPLGIVLIGGEAASAVICACGVEQTEVLAEPWPATPLVVFKGGVLDGVPGVVKSGALGDGYWLVYAVSLLRYVGRTVSP
jgi:uncharacterized protein YgbK (DUF1537 family)